MLKTLTNLKMDQSKIVNMSTDGPPVMIKLVKLLSEKLDREILSI